MLRKFFYSLAAAVAVCTPAFAGVMGISSKVTTFASPDDGLTGQGYTGYILTLMTDDNSVISAIDVNITGALHQRWGFDDDGNSLPSPSSLNITNGDSKLNAITGALVGAALTEDNSGTGSPLADTATRNYGVGTFLKGAWGIQGPSQTNKATMAYIVVKDTDLSNIAVLAQVATANGTFSLTKAAFPDLNGGTVPPAVLVSSPVPGAGIELNFGLLPPGQNPAPLPIALSNSAAGSNPITISSITLAGPDASKFVLTGTLPTSLAGGAAAQAFGVDWGTPGQNAGVYNAQVLVNTSSGNLVFDVQATIPEPATLALAGLAVVGLVGFARRS
jgi:hypothetical protein